MYSEAADAERESAPGWQVRLVPYGFRTKHGTFSQQQVHVTHVCSANTQLHGQLASQASSPTCTLTLSVLELAGK